VLTTTLSKAWDDLKVPWPVGKVIINILIEPYTTSSALLASGSTEFQVLEMAYSLADRVSSKH
jgi:hypothetical protein